MAAGFCSLYCEIHYIEICYIEVWVYYQNDTEWHNKFRFCCCPLQFVTDVTQVCQMNLCMIYIFYHFGFISTSRQWCHALYYLYIAILQRKEVCVQIFAPTKCFKICHIYRKRNTHVVFCLFFISSNFTFYLMNALIYVVVD